MKEFIKKNWKPLTLWSSLGGLLFGGALFAYKKGYMRNADPPVPLPDQLESIDLKTRPFEIRTEDRTRTVRSQYHLQATPFRIWSVLEEGRKGHPVFFVTPRQFLLGEAGAEEEVQGEPFYAAIGIPKFTKKRDLLDHLHEGSQILFLHCLVGGSCNGIPTGEKTLSTGKIASWEFSPAEAALTESSAPASGPAEG